MEKKKICFVVPAVGAARSFFKDHFSRLSSDFDIFVVSNMREDEDLSDLKISGQKAIRIERKPSLISDIKSVFALYKYLRKEKFFCVHSMGPKASLVASIAGWMARVPHRIRIFTGQVWCDMVGLKRKFFIFLDKLTVAFSTELMVDGHSQMEYLEANGVLKKGQASVMANGSICGVDINRFSYSETIRIEERSKLGFTNETVYEFLGRLNTDKGINELLSAFNKLVETCPKVILLLVGSDEEHCRERVKNYPNLTDGKNVIFYGATRDPHLLLQAADIFVMPSYREGFGMSVLEASCVKLPVICSDAYGMRDTMIDNVTGLRCKVRDTDSLYNALLTLYADEAKRKQMGQAGYERATRDFSKKLVTDAWYEYYMNLK